MRMNSWNLHFQVKSKIFWLYKYHDIIASDQPRILTHLLNLILYLVCLSIHYGCMHISWTGKLCLKDWIQILIDISMVWAIDVNLASDRSSLFLLHRLTYKWVTWVSILIRGNIISYTNMTEPIHLTSHWGLRTVNTLDI